MEHKLKFLLDSYGLEELLEDNDITDEYVLTWLIENDMILPEDYFEEGTENECC